MDNTKRYQMARDEILSHCQLLLNAVERCDEVAEAEQLNATLQAVRQGLQAAAYTIGRVVAGE